ncbi:Tif3p NDAI_0D00200 [Naumovozyma dairenensis CBS 421]|uniref:RRM domain-containing protein n=1 Tax=Naumovozyma dairenensis (strain ATCC 10597 / BCRC 20456 / CBS 421 / NBRC 0211 / NRRL Y-12639) TaxID=1071378 RepID=G0W973_NAUDC|nr:hypothetical protein NDAI_0D00200 [Naumovozyma dairenensis CBS 421]CCD24334.1 hypothetical protein NDAI_0D00200 [Naumovozyma dairenensis CBS 421]
MAPPKNAKKTVKLDLNSFLNDDTFGSSWAEEDVDLNKISIPIENVPANTVPLEEIARKQNTGTMGGMGMGMGMGMGGGRGGSRLDPALAGPGSSRRDFSQREEYPVPEHPPFRAIINNIPWDISPEGVKAWVEDGLNKPEAVEEIDLPKSIKDPTRLKGLAFITLKERNDLVKALTFNGTKLNERTVYVSVAAPRRDGYRSGGADFDWGSARGSAFQASNGPGQDADLNWDSARGSNYRAPREEPNLDWDSARGSNFRQQRSSREPREPREEVNLDWDSARGSNFRQQQPREPREEVNLDWDSARGSNFRQQQPREPREPREEVNLDWDSARGSNFRQQQRPPRGPRETREEVNLDWDSARGSNFRAQRPPREPREPREPRKQEPELNWGDARGANFGKKPTTTTTSTKEKASKSSIKANKPVEEPVKIQKSAFDVLRTDDDDEDDEEEEEAAENSTEPKVENKEVDTLATETAKLAVDDDNEWEVVGKK